MIYHIDLSIKDVFRQFNLSTIFGLVAVYAATSAYMYSVCINEKLLNNQTFALTTQISALVSLFMVWIIIRWNITPYYAFAAYEYTGDLYNRGIGGIQTVTK